MKTNFVTPHTNTTSGTIPDSNTTQQPPPQPPPPPPPAPPPSQFTTTTTSKKNNTISNWTCDECSTDSTPVRRGGPSGPATLCNACGLRLKKKRSKLPKQNDTLRRRNKRTNRPSSPLGVVQTITKRQHSEPVSSRLVKPPTPSASTAITTTTTGTTQTTTTTMTTPIHNLNTFPTHDAPRHSSPVSVVVPPTNITPSAQSPSSPSLIKSSSQPVILHTPQPQAAIPNLAKKPSRTDVSIPLPTSFIPNTFVELPSNNHTLVMDIPYEEPMLQEDPDPQPPVWPLHPIATETDFVETTDFNGNTQTTTEPLNLQVESVPPPQPLHQSLPQQHMDDLDVVRESNEMYPQSFDQTTIDNPQFNVGKTTISSPHVVDEATNHVKIGKYLGICSMEQRVETAENKCADLKQSIFSLAKQYNSAENELKVLLARHSDIEDRIKALIAKQAGIADQVRVTMEQSSNVMKDVDDMRGDVDQSKQNWLNMFGVLPNSDINRQNQVEQDPST